MNNQKQPFPGELQARPAPYLEPRRTPAAGSKQRLSSDPTGGSAGQQIIAVPPPKVLQRVSQQQQQQQRKNWSVSDCTSASVASNHKGELAYLIVNLQASPDQERNTISGISSGPKVSQGDNMSLTGLFSKKPHKAKAKGTKVSKMPSFKRKSAPLVVPGTSREEVVAAGADSATPDSVEEREEVFLPAMTAAVASDITQDSGSLNLEGSTNPTTTTTATSSSSSAHPSPSPSTDDRVVDSSGDHSSSGPLPIQSLSEVNASSKPQYANTPSHHKSHDTAAVDTGRGVTGSGPQYVNTPSHHKAQDTAMVATGRASEPQYVNTPSHQKSHDTAIAAAKGHGVTASPAHQVDSVPPPNQDNPPSSTTTSTTTTAEPPAPDTDTHHAGTSSHTSPPTTDSPSCISASRGSGNNTGGQFLSNNQPVGALASAKLRASEGGNVTSTSSLRDLDKENMSVLGRSKTISVVQDSLMGGGEEDVELRRAAVRRAKQSRNRPPPIKPLPYASSRKSSADSIVYKEAAGSSGGGGGGGGPGGGDAGPKTSKLVSPPVSASKSHISPKRPAPPPPKHAPYHRSASSQSPAKSLAILHPPETPPPSNPPPRFPPGGGPAPSSPLAESHEPKRSTLPRRGTPAVAPPTPSSSSSNTSTLPTKKRLSWGATSKHSVRHSPPPSSSSSHSNPSTLTRGSNLGIPPRGVTAATKTSNPATSLPHSTPTTPATLTSGSQKESGPIYEEIKDWVGVARSLPPTSRVHSLSSVYGKGAGQGAWSSVSSPLKGKAGTEERVSDDEDGDDYVDMQPQVTAKIVTDQVTAKIVTDSAPTAKAKAGSEVTPGEQADVKDDDDSDYIDMQALKVPVLSEPEHHKASGGVASQLPIPRQDQDIYVEMQPASRYPAPHDLQAAKLTGLYPAPESAPPIYAPITPSKPKQKWEEPSNESLYYASRDLLALRKAEKAKV